MRTNLSILVFILTLNLSSQNKININANVGINYSKLSVLEYTKNEKTNFNGIGNIIDVKLGIPLQLIDHITGNDVELTIVKDADHRFSTDKCMELICSSINLITDRLI